MQKHLGAEHAIVTRILAGKTPEARAAELVDGTRITDSEIRALLQAGGKATIDISTDPMIVLARSLEADAQAITKRFDEGVVAVQAAAYPKIGQAVFAVDGAKAYPDATGTLRLSYGTVKGYMEDGKKVLPYTVTAGLYERAAEHPGQPDYARPQDALQLRQHQRHRRRQQRVGGGQQEGRAGGPDLRRQHPVAAGLLHLRRNGEPRGVGRLAGDPRVVEESVQG
jgi:hypothetical protein